jgi:hypothetical protein
MTTVAPEAPQWAQHLSYGNEIRVYIAQVKRDLKKGERTIASVLADPMAGSMRLKPMLVSLPRIGEKTVKFELRMLQLDGDKRIRDLTDRQRQVILDMLSKHGIA